VEKAVGSMDANEDGFLDLKFWKAVNPTD